MELPVDPTKEEPRARELLLNAPSDTLFRRAFKGASLESFVDSSSNRESTVDQLTEIQLRRVASQVRYAAPQTIHYFRVPGLSNVTPDELTNLTATSGYGGQVRAVEQPSERVYVICSVPESGTQAQLTVSEDARVTTVATFDTQTKLLAIRAETAGLADGTLNALQDHRELNESTRVSFHDDSFRGRFEETLVAAYERLSLAPTTPAASTERIDCRAKRGDSSDYLDLRDDAIITELLRKDGIRRAEVRARLDFSSERMRQRNLIADDVYPVDPQVNIDFTENSVSFCNWVPENTLVQLDRVVTDVL